MRKLAILTIPFALMMAQDKPPASSAKDAPKTKSAAAPQHPGPVTIPPDAELVGPRTYRHKDANGKTWLYRQTPFGVSRMEEPVAGTATAQTGSSGVPAAAPPAGSKPATIKAIDLGDSVRFEQATPMGKRVWVTKKTELSPKELAVLEQVKKDPAQPEK